MNAHNHSHATKNIGIAFALNLSFTIIEIVGGLLTGSVAILADAIHDLGDSLTLALAYLLQRYSEKGRDERNTYGYTRYSLLGAFMAGSVLIGGSIVIVLESMPRFWEPVTPNGPGMLALSILGMVVNGYAFFKLSKGKSQSEKVLKWHLFEDFAGWIAVLVGSLLIILFKWNWVDPLLAICIAIFVLYNVTKSLRETIGIFLQRAPRDFDLLTFKKKVLSVDGVKDIHDIHVWTLDGERHVLSCHIVMEDYNDGISVKSAVKDIASSMGRYHVTVELEQFQEVCQDGCDSVSRTTEEKHLLNTLEDS